MERDDLAALLAGMSPVDRLKLEAEIAGNQVRPPAEAAKARTGNRAALLDMMLGGRTAKEMGQDVYAGAQEGVGGAARELGLAGVEAGLTALGAPGGRIAKDASRRVNIFAGPEAKTADLEALARAMEERVAGASRDDTWRRQGWAWDERDLPYFEIDDSAAKLSGAAKPQQFGDFLDHPQLNAALPDVGAHRFSQSQPAGGGAFYAGMPGQIDVGPGDPRKQLSIALHEGQHAADESRGGSFGANSRFADPADEAAASERIRSVYGDAYTRAQDLRAQRDQMMRNPDVRVDSPELMSLDSELFAANRALEAAKSKEGLPTDPALYAYLHNPGEVRARNVEARKDFTAADRRERPPWSTIDVDEADILRGGAPSGAPSQVFMPIGGKVADEARDMRAGGMSNEAIQQATGNFFTHEGTPARHIPDFGMKFRPNIAHPGTRMPLGGLIDHPQVFAERPELRNIPTHITTSTVGNGRPLARTLPTSGDFEVSIAPGETRGDIAKLLQYRISQDAGLSPAIRHTPGEAGKALDQSRLAAELTGLDAPSDAVEAYLAKIAPMRSKYDELSASMAPHGVKNPDTIMANKLAGNVTAKQVRQRASIDGAEELYPYGRGSSIFGRNKDQKPAPYEDTIPILSPNMGRDRIARILACWYQYGSGRGP